MISVTIYKLGNIDSIDKVREIINTEGVSEQPVDVPEWPQDDKLERRISTLSIPETINRFDIENVKIDFLLASAYSERTKWRKHWRDAENNLLPKNSRIFVHHTNLLFFKYNDIVYVVFFTQNESTINAIKKDIFNEVWGALTTAEEYQSEDDLLYWLVYTKMANNGVIHSNGFYVTNISYYMGSAVEETHTIKSSGERVCDLLGTMAHILENEPFDSLGISVVLEDESSAFRLYRSGNMKISEVEYIGNLCNNCDGDELNARLCLLVYTKLLPALISTYKQHIKDQLWNQQIRVNFSKKTGMNLLKRIIPQLGLRANVTIGDILKD